MAAALAVGGGETWGQGTSIVPATTETSQAGTGEALTQALDRMAAEAAAFRAAVPNFTCEERIRAEERRGGQPKHVMETQGSFRVLRAADGGWPTESRQIEQEGGRAVPEGKTVRLPVLLTGGFGRVLPLYFDPSRRGCFRYALGADRVEFEAVPAVETMAACAGVAPRLRGFATTEPGTGAVTHLERTVPDEVAQHSQYAAFSAVDFTGLEANGRRLRVPSRVLGELRHGDSRFIFDAQYSGCRVYTGTATLLPNNAVGVSP